MESLPGNVGAAQQNMGIKKVEDETKTKRVTEELKKEKSSLNVP